MQLMGEEASRKEMSLSAEFEEGNELDSAAEVKPRSHPCCRWMPTALTGHPLYSLRLARVCLCFTCTSLAPRMCLALPPPATD